MRGRLVLAIVTATFIVTGGQQLNETICDFGKADGLLDAAVDLFQKARKILINGVSTTNRQPCPEPTIKCLNISRPLFSRNPQDCSDVMRNGKITSGVYTILPEHRLFYGTDGFDVYCDMETDGGGWTVIQIRGNYGKPGDYFYKDWESYKTGFGNLTQDFWLGNDKIYALTSQRAYSIRFDLKDWEGESRFAVYDQFWISEENHNYTLHVADYNGTAGDSLIYHDNMMFTTFDRDNDKYGGNCAQDYKGAWWYRDCHYSNLNGLYLKGKNIMSSKSASWRSWKNEYISLFEVEIKIRPTNFAIKKDVPL